MTPRLTFVIDKAGVIRAAIRHDFRLQEHVPEVLEALKALETPLAT
jgi:peroxiredoxin